MNAIQNARPAANATPAETGARSRQGQADPATNAFEQLLAPKPEPARAGQDASQGETQQPDATSTGAPNGGLPQALADLLRSARTPDAASAESDGDAPAPEDKDNADAAAIIVPQAFLNFAPRPPATPAQTPPASTAPAQTTPANAASIVAAAALSNDGDESDSTSVAAPQPETGSRPERSSIMSAVDDVLKATRHAAASQDRAASDGSNDASPQLAPLTDADADGGMAAAASDDGVKVSFVSMSSTPARPVVVGETLASERPQAAAPPAPPPPVTTPAHQLRLIMEPSGLGAVALHLNMANAQVSVDLEAQRSETRHALESHRDQLVDSLTGAGYDVAHVQVKTASTEAAFDPRREGAATHDAPSERAQQGRDERARGNQDNDSRKGEHADDSRTRAHRSGGVFI